MKENALKIEYPFSAALLRSGSLSAMVPGTMILLGFWVFVLHTLGMEASAAWAVIPGAAALLGTLYFRWDQPKHMICASGLLLVLVAACLIGHNALRSGFAGIFDAVARWRTEQTGYLYFSPKNPGAPGFALVVLGAVSGAIVGLGARLRFHWPVWIMAAAVFVTVALGWAEASPWLAVLLAGCLLLCIPTWQGIGVGAGILALIFLIGFLAFSGNPAESSYADDLRQSVHRWRYETVANLMPEGDFRELNGLRSDSSPALEVSMEHWTGLYLRGFAAEEYTGHGFRPVQADADLMYSLQKNYFYPAGQLAALAKAQNVPMKNRVAVTRVGACKAWMYVPYGASVTKGDPRRILGQGTFATGVAHFVEPVYPVEKAYLMQADLTGEEGAYLDGEAAYRQWVYDTCLEIPGELRSVFAEKFELPEQELSTSQARILVQDWVDSTLTYDNGRGTYSGSADFLTFLLELSPAGHSVQYAALTTMLLRYCGIPARYAEGFRVTKEQASDLPDRSTLVVNNQNARAWAEFYLDGVGWLPLDTTPGGTSELVYELPENGVRLDETMLGSGANQQEEPEKVRIEQEQEAEREHRKEMNPLIWILILLVLLLLAFVGRTVWLRRILKRRAASYDTLSPRRGGLEMLRDCGVYLELLGLPEENVPLTQRSGEIAQLLERPAEEVAPVLELANVLLFRDQQAAEEQRQQCREALNAVREIWKNRTPGWKQQYVRFIACKVL